MRKLLLLCLPLYLALAGCGGVRSHNVTFTWSFEGGHKCSEVGITSVTVKIPGQTLQNSGVFPCNPGGNAADGVTLLKFAPGSYTYELDAADSSGNVLYVDSGGFTVKGDTLVPVDFQYSGTTATWTFAQATGTSIPQCGTGKDMDVVELDVDNVGVAQYACEAGLAGTGQGISSPYIAPGNHTIQLFAYNLSNPNLVYAESQPIQISVVPGSPVNNQVVLNWQVGGVYLVFSDTSNASCSSEGVTNASINFQRPDNSLVFGGNGDVQAACSTTANAYHGFNEFNYPALPADTYVLQYAAPSSLGGTLVIANQPTSVIIGAGNFGTVTSPLQVPLVRR